MSPTRLSTCTIATLILCIACAGEPPPPPAPEPVTVANPELGIELQGIPEAFELETNQGPELVLSLTAVPDRRLGFSIEPSDAGVNLVAGIEKHQTDLEARTAGEYRGAQELATHLGTAFWSRGVFESNGEMMEEARILAIHPSKNATLMLTYVFPAADNSATRMQQLLDVLAVVEPAG